MEYLSDAEVEAVLERTGFGFLGLARDDHPYVLPMSFGYDGDIYFQMNDRGEKYDYIEDGTPASLNVVEFDYQAETSLSVIVEGHLHPVPDDQISEALDTLTANAAFGTDLDLWGVPIQQASPQCFMLVPSQMSGRRFGEATDE